MKITIKGELRDLNTFLKQVNNNRFAGAKVKKEDTEKVYYACKEKYIEPVKDYPIHITFKWYSKDNRKDLDNVAFAKKSALDGLVLAKIIENDSRKFIKGFTDEFYIDKENPRLEIII